MIYRPLPDPVKKQLSQIPEDGLDIFLLAGGSIRGVLVHGTRLIHQARSNHALSPLETTVLGRGLLTGALHSGSLKGKDRAAFKLQGDGPAGGLAVEMNVLGEIRGYLMNRIDEADIPADAAANTATPAAAAAGSTRDSGEVYRDTLMEVSDRMIGSGIFSATRHPEGASQPSQSTVPFAAGSMDSIFESYYLQSEQVPTRIWTSFAWDNTLFLNSAAGLLLQTLPESPRHSHQDFLSVVQYIESQDIRAELARLCKEGLPNSEIARQIFADFSIEIVGSKNTEFFCSCTKDRFAAFIQGLPQQDQQEILHHGPFPLQTSCHYCGSSYEFSQSELKELLVRA